MLSSESNSASASARESSVLPTPVGPEEDERADRPPRVLDARARADDGVGDELHRLVLADHALVQDLVEAQQLLALALHQPRDRDAGPARDHLGDLVLGHLLAQQPRRRPASRSSRSSSRLQPPLELGQPAVAQLGSAVEVVAALGLLDLAPHLLELLAQRLQLADRLALGLPLGGHRVGLRAQVGELLAQRLEPLPCWPRRFSFLSAASSISSCITRRVIASSSCGIESISVRITAHASSTRSIALSGRKRSVM